MDLKSTLLFVAIISPLLLWYTLYVRAKRQRMRELLPEIIGGMWMTGYDLRQRLKHYGVRLSPVSFYHLMSQFTEEKYVDCFKAPPDEESGWRSPTYTYRLHKEEPATTAIFAKNKTN